MSPCHSQHCALPGKVPYRCPIPLYMYLPKRKCLFLSRLFTFHVLVCILEAASTPGPWQPRGSVAPGGIRTIAKGVEDHASPQRSSAPKRSALLSPTFTCPAAAQQPAQYKMKFLL